MKKLTKVKTDPRYLKIIEEFNDLVVDIYNQSDRGDLVVVMDIEDKKI